MSMLRNDADSMERALGRGEGKEDADSTIPGIAQINVRRLYYGSLIAAPLHLIHVVMFIFMEPATENEVRWRTGIIAAHLVMASLMGFYAVVAHQLRKRSAPSLVIHIIPYLAIMSVLIAGSAISAIDQLVTPSINPFVVACMFTATVFVVEPVVAGVIYVSAFAVFSHVMGLAQANNAVLISNKANGLFSVGLAFCLSAILWQANSLAILQRRRIEKQQRELEYLAFYDHMTGLLTRKHMQELSRNEISQMRRYGHSSCMLLIDLDCFKKVNDEYGHPLGDALLSQVASVVRSRLRTTDLVARWGGDEFLVVLPRTCLIDAEAVAEELRAAIGETVVEAGGNKAAVTASIGIAPLRADRVDPFTDAYRCADAALYGAKRDGRNLVRTEPCPES